MELVGTREAFKKMLEVPGLARYLGVDKATVSNWKRYLADGKTVSLDKMEEMLMRFGARVKREKAWQMPYIGDTIVSKSQILGHVLEKVIETMIRIGYDKINCRYTGENNGIFESTFYIKDDNKTLLSFKCRTDDLIDHYNQDRMYQFITSMVAPIK